HPAIFAQLVKVDGVELREPRTVEIAQDPAPLRRILVVVPSQEIPLILREPRHYVPHLARRDVGYVGRRSRFLRRAQDGHQQQDTERPDVHAGLRANRSLISFFTCASSSPSSWSRGGRTRVRSFPTSSRTRLKRWTIFGRVWNRSDGTKQS